MRKDKCTSDEVKQEELHKLVYLPDKNRDFTPQNAGLFWTFKKLKAAGGSLGFKA